MPRPKLIIWTCMRSYSSLVSAMLGQHSKLYTVPEINPFVCHTLDENLATFKLVRPRSLDGLYRLIAQLEFGSQTYHAVADAHDWCEARRHWSPATLMEYVAEKVAPQIVVEKSPSNVVVKGALDIALQYCPEAYYLHLYRNPVATSASIAKITGYDPNSTRPKILRKDPEEAWYDANKGIMAISGEVAPGQFMSVRGEDILRDPDTFLTQICDWMGLETTPEDLEAMRHPENSPYSCFGPTNAPFGADPNFLENPQFKQRPIPDIALDTPLAWEASNRRLRDATVELSVQLGYGAPARHMSPAPAA